METLFDPINDEWNPRWVAYCRCNNLPLSRNHPGYKFIIWISQQWTQFYKEKQIKETYRTEQIHHQFDEWLEGNK